MLEQELASIARFIFDNTGIQAVYYNEMPESFQTPSLYFPVPEVMTRGDTMNSYALVYSWYVKVFDKRSNTAYNKAFNALNAIKQKRNLIPLINPDGTPQQKGIRIRDPMLTKLDTGVVQLKIDWDSVREFEKSTVEKVQSIVIEGWSNPDIYLTRAVEVAFETAINSALFNYPLAGTKVTGE